MGRRRTSPSDALVDRARAGARGTDSRSSDFRPTSPADAYFEQLVGADDDRHNDPTRIESPARDSGSSTGERSEGPSLPSDGAPAEATAIAEELLASGQIDVGQVDVEQVDGADGVSPSSDGSTDEPDARSPAGAELHARNDDGSAPLAGDRWSTSTPEWERRESERGSRQQRRPAIHGPILRVAAGVVAAVFVALGFVGAVVDDRTPIADAAVGDCFLVGEALEVEQVTVVDCAETHDSELFAQVDFVAAFGTVHPGDDALFDWLWEACLARFPGYTGEAYEESRYWIDMFIPTPDGWSNGDHVGMCTLVVVDEDLAVVPSTGSGRAGGDTA